MKLSIADIIDNHPWGKCLVIGHGPSLNKYIPRLASLKAQGYIIIGCNNWNEFYPSCPPHYSVNANFDDNSVNMLGITNFYKVTWIYADSVDLTDQDWMAQNYGGDFLPYDQRHFEGKECKVCHSYGCNKYRDPKRLTIQEELQKYTGYHKHYGTGHTVVLHSMAFAILMGFSEIYLIGLDFDYRKGYALNHSGRQVPNQPRYFDRDVWGREIFEDIETINNSAKNVGTQIFNTNENSPWGIVEYKEAE
jgi:hypothetical protein